MLPVRKAAGIPIKAAFWGAAAALTGGFLNAFLPVADSLSHFRFHISLALFLIAIGLLLVRAIWLGLAAVVMAAIGIAMIYPALPFSGEYQVTKGGIKFIQFNTLFNNPRIPRSIEWLTEQSPDVLALQEVSTKTISIYDAMALQMPSHISCKFAGVGGVAILSKFQKLDEKCLEKLGLVWMRVDLDGAPVTLASVHLHWPYPYRQWQQLTDLRRELEAMPRPAILAGDFNAAPWSETLKRMQRMTDTRIAPGLRLTLRKEFPLLGVIPFLPLDHFLLDSSFTLKSIEAGPPIGSDHLPVISVVSRSGG